MKANPESLAPEEYLWRQLKKRGLLSTTKLEQDFRLKYSRLNVPPKYFKMRETLKAMFMALENDLKFIQRLRSFEEDGEFLRGHAQARAVVKVAQVQGEGAVGFEVDDVFEQGVGEAWPAVGCEAHELVFAGVDAEPAIRRKRRVKQPDRVWEA